MKDCLIVEDVPAMRQMSSEMLCTLGFQTREAESAEQGLAMINEQMPDLVLLDWNLPQMSGIEFLGQLRRHAKGDHPKVIFCTSRDMIDSIREAVGSGADEYIMKPYDMEILATKIVLVGLAKIVPC